mmetsp:Transcript_10610/g.19903  ORF Transcript_10610/g.19903 Transcript_10610/m.19903 type:complete len:242 (+) Transcript_10610:380-1105(+)
MLVVSLSSMNMSALPRLSSSSCMFSMRCTLARTLNSTMTLPSRTSRIVHEGLPGSSFEILLAISILNAFVSCFDRLNVALANLARPNFTEVVGVFVGKTVGKLVGEFVSISTAMGEEVGRYDGLFVGDPVGLLVDTSNSSTQNLIPVSKKSQPHSNVSVHFGRFAHALFSNTFPASTTLSRYGSVESKATGRVPVMLLSASIISTMYPFAHSTLLFWSILTHVHGSSRLHFVFQCGPLVSS